MVLEFENQEAMASSEDCGVSSVATASDSSANYWNNWNWKSVRWNKQWIFTPLFVTFEAAGNVTDKFCHCFVVTFSLSLFISKMEVALWLE